jgi:DNA polymerase/3'-5' exonuclease PolX
MRQTMKESRMKLAQAKQIAEEIRSRLEPSCERVVIAGSIRRQRPYVGDIELLCIPRCNGFVDQLDRNVEALIKQGLFDFRRNKLGSKVYGPKNKLLLHVPTGIGVDIFSTTEEYWAVSLVVRTGGAETNKRIATEALRKDWRWHAYGRGFTTPDGEIICHSEREVFEAVGLPYLEPWERQ